MLDKTADGQLRNKFDADGWYVSVTHRFLDWFEMGVYYSAYYSNTSDRDGKEKAAQYIASSGIAGVQPGMEHNQWSKDLCVATRFDISSNWVFKLEGHVMNGSALMYSDDGNTRINATTGQPELAYEEDWIMVAAKLSYSF